MAKHLTSGEYVNGYCLLCDMQTQDAGTCDWSFARKKDKTLFIKRYLTPVYPSDDAPGSPKNKQKRRDKCGAFERHVLAVEKALGSGGDGGFLVRATDFFRDESGHYFKVTPKIEKEDINVAVLPADQQQLILLTVAYGFRMMHQSTNLVHADIKPTNILLHEHNGSFIAKVIDFDASFFADRVPLPQDVVGDQSYLSPEMLAYILEDGPAGKISQKADVFALGVVFCDYLAGSTPIFNDKYNYACEALHNGESITAPKPRLDELLPVKSLIEQMLDKNPDNRPDMGAVHSWLRRFTQARRNGKSAPPLPRISDTPSRLRIKGLSTCVGGIAKDVNEIKDEPDKGRSGKLRIRGLNT